MTNPGDIERRLNPAAIKKGVAWGTEVDVNAAGNGILPLNAGVPALKMTPVEDESAANAFETSFDFTDINPADFSLDFDHRYQGREDVLLAMIMGTAGAPAPQFTVTTSNKYIDFDQGVGGPPPTELTGTLTPGTFTGATLATAIAAAMNAAGSLSPAVACAYAPSTGKFTISQASGTLNIRWATGTHKATDISDLCGYSDVADDTSGISYASDLAVNTVNLHTLSLLNTTTGIFGTYATAKHTKIHIVPSFKVLKAAFSMNKGLVKSSFSLRGNKLIDTSSIITAMANVTVPDIYNRVKFSQGVFRMNDQTGTALQTSDAIGVKGFMLEIERKMDSERTNQAASIIEPRENDKPTVKLTLDFARMDDANAAYFATWIAETEKKMDLTFTGAVIAGTYYRYLKFEFPRLKIEDVDYPDGNIIPAKMVLRGLVAASAPAGMTAITNPIHVTIQNGHTTDYLAA